MTRKPASPEYVGLPELLAYMDEHGVDPKQAHDHFAALGRTPPPRPKIPVPDGYVLPRHVFVLTPDAEERAKAYGRDRVLDEAEREIEEYMIERVREGRDGSRIAFTTNAFRMPEGDWEDGFVMMPLADGVTVEIDVARWQTSEEIHGRPLSMPEMPD